MRKCDGMGPAGGEMSSACVRCWGCAQRRPRPRKERNGEATVAADDVGMFEGKEVGVFFRFWREREPSRTRSSTYVDSWYYADLNRGVRGAAPGPLLFLCGTWAHGRIINLRGMRVISHHRTITHHQSACSSAKRVHDDDAVGHSLLLFAQARLTIPCSLESTTGGYKGNIPRAAQPNLPPVNTKMKIASAAAASVAILGGGARAFSPRPAAPSSSLAPAGSRRATALFEGSTDAAATAVQNDAPSEASETTAARSGRTVPMPESYREMVRQMAAAMRDADALGRDRQIVRVCLPRSADNAVLGTYSEGLLDVESADIALVPPGASEDYCARRAMGDFVRSHRSVSSYPSSFLHRFSCDRRELAGRDHAAVLFRGAHHVGRPSVSDGAIRFRPSRFFLRRP